MRKRIAVIGVQYLIFMGIIILAVCSMLAISCLPKTPSIQGAPEFQDPAPLRLYPDEVDFWKRLMERDYQRGGLYHADRSALVVDKIILELRKRNGRN
jgi:hypothetical protein